MFKHVTINAATGERVERELPEAEAKAMGIGPAPTTMASIKSEAARRILERYPAWQQINAALGGYDPAAQEAMKTYIGAVRAVSNAIEARLALDPYLDPSAQADWPQA